MDGSATVVRLELFFDDDAMTGTASAAGTASRPFAGWLGLVAAVEAVIAGDGAEARSHVTEPEGPGSAPSA